MRKMIRLAAAVALVGAALALNGCSSHVGVGVNVNVPVGKHGHINVGTGTGGWY
jgi:hypothetical protein